MVQIFGNNNDKWDDKLRELFIGLIADISHFFHEVLEIFQELGTENCVNGRHDHEVDIVQ